MAKGKRVTYHVVYVAGARLWGVQQTGAEDFAFADGEKRKAVTEARRLGKKAAPWGRVVVHGKDGKIQTEWTYGNDPRRTKG